MTQSWDFISWNVCGLRKLARYPGIFSWLLGIHVVFLQETLQLRRSFSFPGFARFDVLAAETKGRASGGLTTLIRKSWLCDGVVRELASSSHLLALRVTWGNTGLLLFNVYVPVFTEGCPVDIYAIIHAEIESITALYPIDGVLVGGDWNAHLLQPRPASRVDRELSSIAASLSDSGFSVFPTSEERPTFRSGVTRSTIDYAFHRGLKLRDSEVARVFIAQHRPVFLSFDGLTSAPRPQANMEVAYGTRKRRLHSLSYFIHIPI